MSGHRSTVELLLPMELTHTDVDVDALLLDGKQRLQAWNEKYSERNSATDAEVRVAEPVSQVIKMVVFISRNFLSTVYVCNHSYWC